MATSKKATSKKEDVVVSNEVEPIQEAKEIDMPAENTPVPHQVIRGVAVSANTTGKVKLKNKKTGQIITGFIDRGLALNQVKQYPHIEIIN